MTSARDFDRDLAASRIAAVRDRFVRSLAGRFETLADLARRSAGPDAAEGCAAADSLRLGLHNLSGAAPTLGMAALGRRAAALENRVILSREADGRIAPEAAAGIASEIAVLAQDSD